MFSKNITLLKIIFILYLPSLSTAQCIDQITLTPVGKDYYSVIPSGEWRGGARVEEGKENYFIDWGNDESCLVIGDEVMNSSICFTYSKQLSRNIFIAKFGSPRVANMTIYNKNILKSFNKNDLIHSLLGTINIHDNVREILIKELSLHLPSELAIKGTAYIKGLGFWILTNNGNLIPQNIGGVKAYISKIKLDISISSNKSRNEEASTEVIMDENERIVNQKSTMPNKLYISSAEFIRVNEVEVKFDNFIYTNILRNAIVKHKFKDNDGNNIKPNPLIVTIRNYDFIIQ